MKSNSRRCCKAKLPLPPLLPPRPRPNLRRHRSHRRSLKSRNRKRLNRKATSARGRRSHLQRQPRQQDRTQRPTISAQGRPIAARPRPRRRKHLHQNPLRHPNLHLSQPRSLHLPPSPHLLRNPLPKRQPRLPPTRQRHEKESLYGG